MKNINLSIRNILLLTVSILTTIIVLMASQQTYSEWAKMDKIISLKKARIVGDSIYDTSEKISVERDIAYSMLYAPDENTIAELKPRLEESRKDVDMAIDTTVSALKKYDFPEFSALRQETIIQFSVLVTLRDQIDQQIILPLEQRNNKFPESWFSATTKLVTQIQKLWSEFSSHFSDIDPNVTLHMRLKQTLAQINEHTARGRALIGRLIVKNTYPSSIEQAELLSWHGATELAWEQGAVLLGQTNLEGIQPYIKDAQSHYFTVYDMVKDIFYLPGNQHGTTYPISADLWFELTAQANDSMSALRDETIKQTRQYAETLEKEAKHWIIIHTALLVFALILCAYSFYIIINRVINPINNMVEAMVSATQGRNISFIPLQYQNRQDEIGKLFHVLNIFQENTEKIRQNSVMLEKYNIELEHSNRELDDFTYIASHDLKEPLRGIHNHALFLMEDNESKLDEESVSRLRRLLYLSKRMEKLISDLLYFSRLGRQDMAIKPTDINAVVHDVENTLDVFINENNAKIIIQNTLPVITCDGVRVTEVFRNLITNAIKYNHSEEKIVEIGFHEKYESKVGKPVSNIFYVKDNGNGIRLESYDEVFRIFRRLQTTKDDTEGTGVGLTFVKKIIERHEGEIWIDSEVGKGTIFYFTLAK